MQCTQYHYAQWMCLYSITWTHTTHIPIVHFFFVLKFNQQNKKKRKKFGKHVKSCIILPLIRYQFIHQLIIIEHSRPIDALQSSYIYSPLWSISSRFVGVWTLFTILSMLFRFYLYFYGKQTNFRILHIDSHVQISIMYQ